MLLALRRARAHTSFGDASMKALGNLPGQLTSFVGREATIATVRRRLPGGPAGQLGRPRRVWQDPPRH